MDVTVEDLLAADTIDKRRVEYLVRAETSGELERHLENILQYVDDEVVSWERVGELLNNAVVAEVTDNMTGVVENVTNTADAYLLQNYEGGSYQNSHEAAADLLDGDESVTMRFDGNKGKGRGDSDFSITFADRAHGQAQEDFDVFLNPLASGVSKQEHPFLQGCRGIGGMTALSHTEEGHKFIASASDENPEEWTWTVIRQGDDGDYYYLTIDGEFPTFSGAFDCGDGIGEKRYGTVVKLYSYDLGTNPENAAGGPVFRRRLGRYIPDPVVPIDIVDTRYEEDNCCRYNGLRAAVEDNAEAFHGPIGTTDDLMGVGPVAVEAYVAKSDDVLQQMHDDGRISADVRDLRPFFTSNNDDRLLVTVNGQSHARYTKANLKAEANLPNAGTRMLVFVRLLDSSASSEQDMFNTARDGFSDTRMEKRLLAHVRRFLRDNQRLQELDDEFQTADKEPTDDGVTGMRPIVDNLTVPHDTDTIAVPLSFDAPPSEVDPTSVEVTTPSKEYAVRAEVTEDGGVAYLTPQGETVAGTADTVTLIGRFGDASAAPQVTVAYEQEETPETTAPSAGDDWSFADLISADDLHQTHETTLENLETYDIADIAYDLLTEHSDDDVLSNIECIVREGKPKVERRAAIRGKDISQARRVAVGNLFETLVYVTLVDECEQRGYVVHHEPTFDDIDGIDGNEVKPDMDIVIEPQDEERGPLYIFSLKTSLRERIGQSLFWKLLLDMSMCDCSDDTCIVNTHDASVLTENDRDAIYYGYVTLGWSNGGNTGVLDRFDMGYIPSQNTGDDIDNQYALSSFVQHLDNDWSDA